MPGTDGEIHLVEPNRAEPHQPNLPVLANLLSCRADVADLAANLARLVDSPGLPDDAGDQLRAAWSQLQPWLSELNTAISAARDELEPRATESLADEAGGQPSASAIEK